MAKKETVYCVAFEIYEVMQAEKSKQDKMRKYIRENLNKRFPDKTWFDLSALEKNHFILIEIKDKFISDYIDISKQKRINAKIDKLISESMLQADMEIKEYNEKISNVYKSYYNEVDSDEDKKGAYEQFCNDLANINELVPIPTYEQWIHANESHNAIKKTPHRDFGIYDYLMSYINENHPHANLDYYNPVSQAQVDHVLLQTIVSILKVENNIKIDIPLIKECLEFTNNFYIEDFEEFLTKYDPSLPLSKKEQDEIIEQNKKYITYKNMLEKAEFYKKVD